MERFIGLVGIVGFLALAIAMSRDRSAIHWRTVGWALVLQWILAVVVLKGSALAPLLAFMPWPVVHIGATMWGFGWIVLLMVAVPALLRRYAAFESKPLNWTLYGVAAYCALWGNMVGRSFERLRDVVQNLMQYANQGASFVFGSLANPAGSTGMIFAFVVLPVIIFVASIFAVLYYFGIMQWVVGAMAKAIGKLLKVSGAESVAVAASIMMGQTEAPLTVRPFLGKFTRSELMTIMTAGMAHVSGSIMVAYVQIAHVDIVHLLTAVIMTAPGAIMMAKIMEPETDHPATSGDVPVTLPMHDANVLDAAARGASEGLQLALNVAGMLVAFIALVALVNGLLTGLSPLLSLESILGTVFKPFAFVMGVPWAEAGTVGQLLGKRMVVNEFVAFIELGKLPELSTKAKLISTFALCGFANFSSIAIQIGGIGALIPERRGDLARLGLRAMIAGTLANFLSACIAGIMG